MFYLVCRADQIPDQLYENRPIEFTPSITYYPRIVWADHPEEAVERAFHPEKYKPAGVRELVVIELGEFHQITARPVKEPNYTLHSTKPKRKLLRRF